MRKAQLAHKGGEAIDKKSVEPKQTYYDDPGMAVGMANWECPEGYRFDDGSWSVGTTYHSNEEPRSPSQKCVSKGSD